MTQPVWTLTDKEKIKKTLELIQDFEKALDKIDKIIES